MLSEFFRIPKSAIPNPQLRRSCYHACPIDMAFTDPTFHQPRAPANPRLLKALATAACAPAAPNDAAAKQSLYEALLNSVLLIPTSCVPLDGANATSGNLTPRGKSPQFLLIEDDHGAVIPGFTDLQAMQRWSPGATGFISVPVPQLLRESFPSTASGIWLNVADRAARFVSRAELAQITGGMIQPTYLSQVEKDLAPPHSEFVAKLPDALPADVIQRLQDALKREPDVSAGYVLEVETSPKPRGRVVLGVRLARLLEPQAMDLLLKRIAINVNPKHAHRGAAIDVLILDYQKFKQIAGAVPAIYERA
jgi:hypothetical protein